MQTTLNIKSMMKKTAKKIGGGAHVLVPRKHIGKELIIIEEEKENDQQN